MQKTKKLVALVMAVLVALTGLVACSNKPANDQGGSDAYYIGKVPITLKHDVHGNDAKWAEKYAKEQYGATYEVIDPDSDLNKEIAAVETFIGKGVDGIILHPVDENGVNEIIDEVRANDIKIMTYNVKASGNKVPFLGIDEAEVAAQMGADMCKQWMELYPDRPVKIGLIRWTNIAFCFDNRTGPFLKGAKTVVDYLPTDSQLQEQRRRGSDRCYLLGTRRRRSGTGSDCYS